MNELSKNLTMIPGLLMRTGESMSILQNLGESSADSASALPFDGNLHLLFRKHILQHFDTMINPVLLARIDLY